MQIHSEEFCGCWLKLDNSSTLELSVSQLSQPNLPEYFPVEDLCFASTVSGIAQKYIDEKWNATGRSNINWLAFSWLKQLSKLWRHRPFSYWPWLPSCAAPVQPAASSTKPEMPSSWKVTTFKLLSSSQFTFNSGTFETRPASCTTRDFVAQQPDFNWKSRFLKR